MGHDGIAIGELSRRTGCNIETVRYYERIGLLPKPSRRGTYQRYEAQDVRRLAFVRRARELGFTLDEVRALLALAMGGQDACAEVREIAASHLTDVRTRIADLRAMERALAQAVRGCDAGEMAGCPVIDALSSTANYRERRATLSA
jgi:MerR family transcriptional regulator, mercuric resistance operon regulatory protein